MPARDHQEHCSATTEFKSWSAISTYLSQHTEVRNKHSEKLLGFDVQESGIALFENNELLGVTLEEGKPIFESMGWIGNGNRSLGV